MKHLFALTLAALFTTTACAAWEPFMTNATLTANGSLQWSVPSDDAETLAYKIVDGDTCVVSFAFANAQISGIGHTLLVHLPVGVHPVRYTVTGGFLHQGVETIPLVIDVGPGDDTIRLSRTDGVFIFVTPQIISLCGEITFEISPIRQDGRRDDRRDHAIRP